VAAVERALSKHPSITYVSAGWWSDSAIVGMRTGATIELSELDSLLRAEGFQAKGLKRRL
jgi:hypothetical protein